MNPKNIADEKFCMAFLKCLSAAFGAALLILAICTYWEEFHVNGIH